MQEKENVEIEQEKVENNINTDETTVTPDGILDEIVETEAEKFEVALTEQKDKYLRLLAEFENYKRRTSKERIDLIQSAGKDILISLF